MTRHAVSARAGRFGWLVLLTPLVVACGAPSHTAAVPRGCEHPPRTEVEWATLERRCPGIKILASYSARISDDGQYVEVTACDGPGCEGFVPYRVPVADLPRDKDGHLLLEIKGRPPR